MNFNFIKAIRFGGNADVYHGGHDAGWCLCLLKKNNLQTALVEFVLKPSMIFYIFIYHDICSIVCNIFWCLRLSTSFLLFFLVPRIWFPSIPQVPTLPYTPGQVSEIHRRCCAHCLKHVKRYGVSVNGGTPIAGWFMMENPNLKWMMNRGTPILGNLHMNVYRNGTNLYRWMFSSLGESSKDSWEMFQPCLKHTVDFLLASWDRDRKTFWLHFRKIRNDSKAAKWWFPKFWGIPKNAAKWWLPIFWGYPKMDGLQWTFPFSNGWLVGAPWPFSRIILVGRDGFGIRLPKFISTGDFTQRNISKTSTNRNQTTSFESHIVPFSIHIISHFWRWWYFKHLKNSNRIMNHAIFSSHIRPGLFLLILSDRCQAPKLVEPL